MKKSCKVKQTDFQLRGWEDKARVMKNSNYRKTVCEQKKMESLMRMAEEQGNTFRTDKSVLTQIVTTDIQFATSIFNGTKKNVLHTPN